MTPAPAASGAHPMATTPVRVRRVFRESSDVVTLELDPPHPGYRFAPGQFNMLYAFGVGEIAVSHSGDPGDATLLRHTVRVVGAVSGALAALRRGDTVGVRGPFGTAWPLDEARGRDVVVMAGGVGVAPLRPAIYHLLAHRDDYQTVAVLYGARNPGDLLFRHELERWRGRFDVDLRVIVDAAGIDWHGRVGVVTALVPGIGFDPANAVGMLCGPEVMMRFGARSLAARGVARDRLWVSLERNMQCGVGLCGHCQFGPMLVCRDGPVVRHDRVAALLDVREV